MDFESVNAFVNKTTLPTPMVGPMPPGLTTPPTLATLCSYYEAAKPILELVVALPFFPAAWRSAISNLMVVIEALCGTKP